ncbi:MAG: aminotransferase class I/II-fold pyridoxal phosphate-dependent enzyme, partial [Lentisphaeria bacterium]
MIIPQIELSSTSGNLQPSMTLAITTKAKSMITQGIDVISMCAGEPDYDTPENIKSAAIKAIEDGDTKYTRSSGRLDLCQAISKKFKESNNLDYAGNQILVSPGGKFSLMATI